VDQGGDYQKIGSTFEEMGFKEIDERNESRILGPFGVPPILIGTRTGLVRSTYSNYELARRAYWEDTAVPELQLFEAEFQYFLRTDDGGFVAYDKSKVPALQQNVPDLIEAAFKMWQMGTSANQAFSEVGLKVAEIPGGDVGYISKNVVPVGIQPAEEEQSMAEAVEAEEDAEERGDKLLAEWGEAAGLSDLPPLINKEKPRFLDITCPLCQAQGVDVYDDHGGLCVCRGCQCTFDPQVQLEKYQQRNGR
jgi:hypothetical protein